MKQKKINSIWLRLASKICETILKLVTRNRVLSVIDITSAL